MKNIVKIKANNNNNNKMIFRMAAVVPIAVVKGGINKSILNNIGEPRLVSSALQSNSTVFRVDINNIINMNISTTLQEAMQKLESVIHK